MCHLLNDIKLAGITRVTTRFTQKLLRAYFYHKRSFKKFDTYQS